MKVFAYRNLHQKCISLKALEGENKGRVIAHVSWCLLKNAQAKVSQVGRLRVIAEQQKNVHAGIVGELTEMNCITLRYNGDFSQLVKEDCSDEPKCKVTYNPYKFDSFVFADDFSKFEKSAFAKISPNGVFVHR